ncbi:uncharacterized protein LOC120249472 [Dioscorea cayenensis subsp. rotundata]|uniref:Uncharacterized protein LOC120249472 n=1 Tax=Dioscorea cayennensis subsp. rotundata TaxID=55577 RepID=A0AB40AGA8_DIOCR|nr:uncharacterized protein LOC120249472 [Dioscorea cayenensis subsp. rotundata]
MCILCVVQRWSRRLVTMLPWLVIPLIALWAFSQLLPPRFRFEVTSPRLACVTVLLVTLFWYEILMPQLSVWRARCSARLRERRRAQALELQRLRKAATRRCRNCLTPYRDQKPGCGQFMCSYCGHISKRPVLDLPEGSGPSLGINGWICGYAWAAEGNGSRIGPVPRYWVGNNRCMTEKSYSGALLCASKLLSYFLGSIWWILRKIFRIGSSSKDSPDGDNKGSLSRGENGGNCQESRGEKSRRKAEEKRQARLEKEMLEEEERKQREEVARLVEERRKLRDEILEAERIHSRGSGLDGDRDRRKEAEKRRQDRKKEKDKGSSKSNSDVEEFDKKTSRENEKKRKLDKKYEIERRDGQKFVAGKYKCHTSESGNGLKVATSKSKYFDRITGSSLSPSKGFDGASFFGRNAQGTSTTVAKVNKFGYVDQTFSSAIRKDVYPAIHAMGKITSAADDRISKSNFDRAVGSEVRPPTAAPKKSWHQLFTRSTIVSPHDGVNTNGFSNQNEKAETHNECMMDQRVAASYSLDSQISVQPSSFGVSPSVNVSRGGNLVSHSLPAESISSERVRNSILEEAEIFEDPCYNPYPLSLLGPVSDSLDNFPLDLGAGFVSCNKMDEPHNASKKITAPADVIKPSPIESPISRSRISEEKRTAIGQSPSTPKSLDGASIALEQRTWQMWGTPLAQDALDMVTGPSNWILPLGQKKSNLDDMMMHPLSHTPVLSPVAVENLSIPGTHSPQNAHVDNSLNGGMFSRFGHGLNESDIWMRKPLFPQLAGDGESHVTFFPQFNPMDNAARNEMRHDASNGSEALRPFDLPPANFWSKKEWALHGLQDAGNSNPALNPGSLFSTGPDVQSVWASNQMDRI